MFLGTSAVAGHSEGLSHAAQTSAGSQLIVIESSAHSWPQRLNSTGLFDCASGREMCSGVVLVVNLVFQPWALE